jgi:hypothetical protein
MAYMARYAGPEGKVAAAMMLAGIGATGGTFAFPFAQDATSLAEALYSKLTGNELNFKAELDNFLSDHIGDIGADMAVYGPVATLFGVDLASRVGYGNLIGESTQSAWDLLGAAPSVAIGMLTRLSKRYNSGQTTAAVLSEALPATARNLLQGAVVYPQQGIESASGTTIVRPEDLTTGDMIRRMVGAAPLKAAQAYDLRDAIYALRQDGKPNTQALEATVANMLYQAILADKRGDPATAEQYRQRASDVIQEGARQGFITNSQSFSAAIRARIAQHLNPAAALTASVPRAKKPEALDLIGDTTP